MRWFVAVTSALLIQSLAVAHSAPATNTTMISDTTVVSKTGLPARVGVFAGQCSLSDPSNGVFYNHVTGPGSPNFGTGSLHLRGVAPFEAILYDTTPPIFSRLSTFEATTYSPTGGITFSIWLRDPTTLGTLYFGLATAAPAATWATTDGMALTYHWAKYDDLTNLGDHTPAEFLSQQGHGELIALTELSNDCQHDFFVDALRLGTPGAIATFDFEGGGPTALTGKALPRVIDFGQRVTVRCVLSSEAIRIPNQPVSLWAKEPTASTFRQVSEGSSNAAGVVSVTRNPKHSTIYQWRYVGNVDLGPSRSQTISVPVRTVVTKRIVDRSLHKGQSLVVKGHTSPSKPGAVVTLWRRTAAGPFKLDVAREHANGTYWLTKIMSRRGTVRVFVSISAVRNNAAGRSSVGSARVT